MISANTFCYLLVLMPLACLSQGLPFDFGFPLFPFRDGNGGDNGNGGNNGNGGDSGNGGNVVPGERDARWDYNDTNWGNQGYDTCNGKRQSPIALRTSEAQSTILAPIRFTNYDVDLSGDIEFVNNGHSVEVEVTPTTNGRRPLISGGRLTGVYEALNVHFHWGSRNSRGSEHTINNQRFDVEMHIVHKNVRYATVEEASRNPDGIAVLGIMLKITEDSQLFFPGLDRIFEKIPSVRQYNARTTIDKPFRLGWLLGNIKTENFFAYSGSLTTPPCSEAVSWIVFPQAIPVEYAHIARFWEVQDVNGNLLLNNFRPLQPRNNRIIVYRINAPSLPFFQG